GEQVGTPRRISLKRELPHRSSRRISGVQRWQRISVALETGQNWLYPLIAPRGYPASEVVLVPATSPGHHGRQVDKHRRQMMNANKALWEKGDFTRIAETMRESGEALIKELGITNGLDVLDLGCGDGTTAL